MGTLTGFGDLDRKLEGGLKDGYLYFIGARPAMGKTMFAINMIDHICRVEKKTALFFSLEMTRKQVVERLIALEGHVDSRKIRDGDLQTRDWDNVIEAAEIIKDMSVVIDDTPGLKIEEFREKCAGYKVLYNDLSVIFVDYIQLMSASGHYDSRNQEMADILSGLKDIARELEVPVVALSQLSRSVETREDHVPLLKDLKEINASDKDIDVVMFLYRDEYYYPDTERKGIAEIHVSKNHGGTRGTCELVFIPDIMKFANVPKDKK